MQELQIQRGSCALWLLLSSALRESLETQCHCHGVSASCNTRTCWQALPSFKKVSIILKESYTNSVLVRPQQVDSPYGKRDAFLTLRSEDFRKPPPKALVYLDHSPSYCDRNQEERIPGTVDRECDRKSTGEDGCELMCCGRGYNTHEIVRRWRCHCKFHWCCYVKCKKCKERVEVFKCK